MNFKVKDTLTEEEVQKGLKSVIKDGLATQAMVTFTSSIFLVAFALRLGASNLIIGLLAAIPPLAQLFQIPAIYLVKKVRKRKIICVYTSAISRTFWLLIALIPILFDSIGLILLLMALLFNTIFSAISNCSWNSWIRDLIPSNNLGDFFSKRMSLAMAIGIFLSLTAGFFIDEWKKIFPAYALHGYSILFFMGFIAGMIGIYFILAIPEPRMIEKKTKFSKLVLQPFKDKNFKNLIAFSGSWSFAVNLATPFFTVYMLKMLGLSISFVIMLSVLNQIASLAFLRIWGRLSDSYSNKSVLAVSSPFFLLCVFAWTFTTMPDKHVLSIPLLIAIHFFMGISLAGVNLASRNISLKLAPREQATSYLATNSIINSISASIAPIIGGGFADFLANRQINWKITYSGPEGSYSIPMFSFQQWDFFFIFAFLIGLYSIRRLAIIKEEGEVEKKVVINRLVTEIKRPNGLQSLLLIKNKIGKRVVNGVKRRGK